MNSLVKRKPTDGGCGMSSSSRKYYPRDVEINGEHYFNIYQLGNEIRKYKLLEFVINTDFDSKSKRRDPIEIDVHVGFGGYASFRFSFSKLIEKEMQDNELGYSENPHMLAIAMQLRKLADKLDAWDKEWIEE